MDLPVTLCEGKLERTPTGPDGIQNPNGASKGSRSQLRRSAMFIEKAPFHKKSPIGAARKRDLNGGRIMPLLRSRSAGP